MGRVGRARQAHAARRRRARAAALRARRGESRRPRSSSPRCGCPSRSRCPRRSPRRSATSRCSPATSSGCGGRPGAATRTWSGCAAARSSAPRTPWSCPRTRPRSARVLEVCAAEGVAVVPFGGGTSVVGGVDPLAGPHGRVIALDLRRMRSVAVDPISQTATLGPGLRGPEAERALGERGFTAGHFPQSFEYATVGGFAATRSAGQASSRLRALRRDRHRGRAGDADRERCGPWRRRTPRPGRRCASSWSAPRARSG